MSPETAEPLLAEEVKTRSLDDGILREPIRFEGFDFEAELKKAQNFLYATALTYMRNAEAAEEVAHEAGIRAFMKIDQLREPKAFLGWMKVIVVRLCLNKLTRGRAHQAEEGVLENEVARENSDPSLELLAAERSKMVQATLRRVSAMDREALDAFYLRGQSIQEISDVLQVPEGTVKRRLHVARLRYKTVLMNHGYFHQEGGFTVTFQPRGRPSSKKLAASAKTTNVANMSNGTLHTPDSLFAEFKQVAKKEAGTTPVATLTDFERAIADPNAMLAIRREYGKIAERVMETYARKFRALTMESNGKKATNGKPSVMSLVRGGRALAALSLTERETFVEELLNATTVPDGPGYDALLEEFGLTEDTFAQLLSEGKPASNGVLQGPTGNNPIDAQPVVPTVNNPAGEDTTSVRKNDADLPPTEAEHIADSVEGTKAFMIAYVLAGQHSPDTVKAREELCEIFGVNTASIDQFDLDEYARRLDVPPPNPDAKRVHRPAELKQALRILGKNDKWREHRTMSRIAACFGLASGNLQAWVDAKEEFLDLSGKSFTVPVKPEERPATMVATEVSTPDVVANTPPGGIAHTTAPEPTESFEPQSVPTPDVRLQQLTAENQELKTRNEKLTASVELLGKEIQELRTRIDQALARDLQQSPATQVIEVSPDGTTKNVVRITVEVALAQKK